MLPRPPAPIMESSFASWSYALDVRPGRRPLTNTGPEITDYDIRYRVQGEGDFIDWPTMASELKGTITD